MSLHATTPETAAALKRQRVVSLVTSMIIGLLTIVLLMLILSLFLLAPLFIETPTIVTYETSTPDTTEIEVKKVPTNLERTPSAPAMSMARVIAARTNSAVAVPVPEVEVTMPSLDFGNDDNFGEGWGTGNGSGAGGGGAMFFQQKVAAERVVYVIDYSASMRGEREKLMRKELAKSVSGLAEGMKFQMIFFAGPAWVAGDEVTMTKNHESAKVEFKGKDYNWTGKGANDWKEKGAKREIDWIDAGSTSIRRSKKLIEDTRLVWGTCWEPPLDMALAMDPPPQVIFFMTDGLAGKDSLSVAKSIGSKARARDIKINTIAMMEPKAQQAMGELAKRSGGEFTIIEQNGKARKVPVK